MSSQGPAQQAGVDNSFLGSLVDQLKPEPGEPGPAPMETQASSVPSHDQVMQLLQQGQTLMLPMHIQMQQMQQTLAMNPQHVATLAASGIYPPVPPSLNPGLPSTTTEESTTSAAVASSGMAAQMQHQQMQLQRHQEALAAQKRYIEQQHQYIQQLCTLQDRIRHETPESAAKLLTLKDPPLGRPNQWNYTLPPSVPPVSISAPKSRLLPKEQVEKLSSWFLNNILHPYPSKDDLMRLVRETNLTETQVTNWFNNARRRHKNLFNLPERAVRTLHAWFSDHLQNPFPTSDEVQLLCRHIGLGMTPATVERWIAHARTLHRHLTGQRGDDSGSETGMPGDFATPTGSASVSPTQSGNVTPHDRGRGPVSFESGLPAGMQPPPAPSLVRAPLPGGLALPGIVSPVRVPLISGGHSAGSQASPMSITSATPPMTPNKRKADDVSGMNPLTTTTLGQSQPAVPRAVSPESMAGLSGQHAMLMQQLQQVQAQMQKQAGMPLPQPGMTTATPHQALSLSPQQLQMMKMQMQLQQQSTMQSGAVGGQSFAQPRPVSLPQPVSGPADSSMLAQLAAVVAAVQAQDQEQERLQQEDAHRQQRQQQEQPQEQQQEPVQEQQQDAMGAVLAEDNTGDTLSGRMPMEVDAVVASEDCGPSAAAAPSDMAAPCMMESDAAADGAGACAQTGDDSASDACVRSPKRVNVGDSEAKEAGP